MKGQFRYPNIRGATDREQLTEIRNFLYQLVDELNHTEAVEKTADSTVTGVSQDDAGQIARNAATAALYTVTLQKVNWLENGGYWIQKVQIPDVTARTKAELLADRQTTLALWNAGCLLTVENAERTVVVYASGNRPEEDITVQISVTRAKAKD